VREDYEYDIANIGGELIPLGKVEEHINKISSDKDVVIYCRSGKRSADAIQVLEKKYGFKNLYNLKGGILAYADEIDQSLAKY
jgi:adenylyltransferase/sulfurtransferase